MKLQLLFRSASPARSAVFLSRRNCSGMGYEETLSQYVKARNWKMIGAHLFFRHGERTPTHVIRKFDNECFLTTQLNDLSVPGYPVVFVKEREYYFERLTKYVHKKKETTVMPPAEITSLGQRNMRTLGNKIRRRYMKEMKLMSDDSPRSQLYCRSTRWRRNIRSMRCFLGGFYDYHGASDEAVEPQPLYTALAYTDPFSYLKDNPISTYYKSNNHLYEYYPEIDELKAELVKELGLSKISNSTASAWMDELPLTFIHDDLVSRLEHNFPLPSRIIELLPRLGQYCTLDLCYRKMGPESAWHDLGLQVTIGPAFNIIMKNVMEQFHREPGTPALRLYCTQDVFLIPFLVTTGVFDGRWPRFGSYLALELYQAQDGEHWVLMHYNDQLMMELTFEEWKAYFERYATTEAEYKRIVSDAKIERAAW